MHVRKCLACWHPAQCLLRLKVRPMSVSSCMVRLVPTSLQGEEEVPVSLQLFHEFLILQEEGNSLIF